jgi:hypothetical protein
MDGLMGALNLLNPEGDRELASSGMLPKRPVHRRTSSGLLQGSTAIGAALYNPVCDGKRRFENDLGAALGPRTGDTNRLQFGDLENEFVNGHVLMFAQDNNARKKLGELGHYPPLDKIGGN